MCGSYLNGACSRTGWANRVFSVSPHTIGATVLGSHPGGFSLDCSKYFDVLLEIWCPDDDSVF